MTDLVEETGPNISPDFWANLSPAERALIAGHHGTAAFAKEERNHFLGELQERVLASISKIEVEQPEVNEAVAEAARDPRASAIIVNADLRLRDAQKYQQVAEANHLTFTMRGDAAFTGDMGLIVLSEGAVLGE